MRHKNKALDLARMMIKQAIFLKRAGMISEARSMARRAWEMNVMAHATAKLQPVPIRISRR